MRANVARWGNSLAVRLPRAFAEQLGVTEGSDVDIALADDAIVLRKPRFSLKGLLAGVTPENLHGETSTGKAVGHEEW